MRIAHIVSTFPPYHGGMGNVCYYGVQELVRLGYDVTVFTPEYRAEKLKTQNSKLKTIYLRPILKFGNAAFVPQIIRYLKKFEIIHLHWPFIGGAEAILLYSYIRKKFVFRSHLVVQYQMDLVGQGILGWLFNFYQTIFIPLMVRTADKIIVSSFDYAQNSRLKKYLSKYPDKFIEISLGVDTSRFRPAEKKEELLKKYNLNFDDKIILFVGGLDRAHYFKGLDILLRALHRLSSIQHLVSSIKLLVVGEGDLRLKYEKLAKDLGMGEKVIFAGRVPDEELPNYYNLADIFVLPSTTQSEAFGMVLLEAMACAKPIIVSNLPGPRILVQENINGLLFKTGDSDDLVQKIKFLLENQKIAKKWGSNGRKLVEERYSWGIICQKLNEIYQEL